MKHKVIIADDHKIFRDGFKLVLGSFENVELVGEAVNGEELINLLKTQESDIIFMDVNMPVMDGIQATQLALKEHPDLKIIALTSYEGIDYVNKMLMAGVEGYLLKDAEYEEIEDAIASVMSGKNFFSKKILVNLTKNTVRTKEEEKRKLELPRISQRELEILGLICKGQSKRDIAQKLFISERTVEKHKENLMLKTNTNSTVSLVIYALRNKIAEI